MEEESASRGSILGVQGDHFGPPGDPFWASRGSILGLLGGPVRKVRPRRPNLAFWGPFGGHFGVVLGSPGEAILRGSLSVFLCFCRKGVHWEKCFPGEGWELILCHLGTILKVFANTCKRFLEKEGLKKGFKPHVGPRDVASESILEVFLGTWEQAFCENPSWTVRGPN